MRGWERGGFQQATDRALGLCGETHLRPNESTSKHAVDSQRSGAPQVLIATAGSAAALPLSLSVEYVRLAVMAKRRLSSKTTKSQVKRAETEPIPRDSGGDTPPRVPDRDAAGPAQAISRETPCIQTLPADIREFYEIHEWRHACAVLRNDFPAEYSDILDVLRSFRLNRSHVEEPGGRKSRVAEAIDSAFFAKTPPWVEKMFETGLIVDGSPIESPTHSVDCFRNGVAVEVEWNNKDPFYDRDLNNFRLLFDLRVVSVGVIVTRCDELQENFNSLGRGKSYGASTTHMSKLLPKLEGGGGGGCPVLVFGIRKALYMENR